jgi:hypothetical protein
MGWHVHMRLHNIDVGDIPVARRKRSAPAKQRESVADEGTGGGGAVLCCEGTFVVRWRYRGGWRRLRGCLFRSLLSLFRYAALQGRGIKREI